jgi:hypothetical protein
MKVIKKILLHPMKKIINYFLKPFGYLITHKSNFIDYYLHKYSSYEEYRDIQIFYNVRKINAIWADKNTLNRVGKILQGKIKKRTILGLCHGARNGFEQNYLNSLNIGIKAIGTDISKTALDYKNSVQWDFHDVKSEWKDGFDFIYSNSLDQSWQPKKAILVWLEQLNEKGILILEYTEDHGPKAASEMDPFGVKPTVVPYVLTMWFGSQISITHSVAKKDNKTQLDAWLFVVSKNVKKVKELAQDKSLIF